MWFDQTQKLARTILYGYNYQKSRWDALPMHCQLEGSTPETAGIEHRLISLPELPSPVYQHVRIDRDPKEYLLLNSQPNIQADSNYRYSLILLGAKKGWCTLKHITMTKAASGIGGTKTEAIVGVFPIAFGPDGSNAGQISKNVDETHLSGYLPTYAGVSTNMYISWEGNDYDINQAFDTLLLTEVVMVKR